MSSSPLNIRCTARQGVIVGVVHVEIETGPVVQPQVTCRIRGAERFSMIDPKGTKCWGSNAAEGCVVSAKNQCPRPILIKPLLPARAELNVTSEALVVIVGLKPLRVSTF